MDQSASNETENNAQEQRKTTVIGRPWQPGESGNPGGRPKGQVSLVNILLRKLAEDNPDMPAQTRAEAVVDTILAKAKEGDVSMLKEVLDRVDGKVSQPVAVTTENISRDAKVERIKAKVKESQKAALKN